MATITVVGVGLEANQLTLAAAEALKSGARVILHTGRIGCAGWLAEQNIPFDTLDFLYEECEDFDEHASRAADHVLDAAHAGDVVYAVYDVRDRSVLRLAEMEKKLRVVPGVPVEGALMAHLDGAARLLEASDWENFRLSATESALVRELDSRELASEVKLKLMDCYPDETRCLLLNGDGSISRIPLYDLDRMKEYDHRSCVLVPAQRDLTKLERFGFDELMQVIHILRGPDGCPWDRAQTHESLRPFLLEEAYEVIDAINAGDMEHLYDVLGDVLLQVALHAEIGSQYGEFEIGDSLTAICRKMIDRHSHIFGGDQADDPDQVLDLWTRNKMKERGQRTHTEVLREVSRSLPALLRGKKLADKAARAGVREEDARAIAADAAERLEGVIDAADREAALGEALFLLCALARELDVDPEIALNEAGDRSVNRFEELEISCQNASIPLPGGSENAKKYWNRVKLQEIGKNRQELTEE